VSLALLLALAACAPGAAPSAPAAPAAPASGPPAAAPGQPPAAAGSLQALVEAARAEGSLSLIWGEGTLGGAEGTRRLAEGFNRHYGLNLSVRFTPGESMPPMLSRLTEEYRAGKPAATDLYAGYGGYVATGINSGLFEPVDWASWAPNVQNPALLATGGQAVVVESSMMGITYNTSKVRADEAPTSLQDLLKPQFKGRVATTPYTSGFERLAVPEMWGEQRTLDYMTRLADQLAGLLRCGDHSRIVAGEFDVFALDCSQSSTLDLMAKGAPITFVFASDAPFVQLLYLAVPKNSAHPNAAKLWINYLLSREAQDVLYDQDYADLHLLEGSKTAKDIARFAGGHIDVLPIDVAFYQQHDEANLVRIQGDLQKIVTK
jgi:iron(III) transport system substrate-binding protein